MPRDKEKYRFDDKRGVVRGRFHTLKQAGQATPLYAICTIGDWEYKITSKGKKKRTVIEQAKYLDLQYQKKQKELEKNRAEKNYSTKTEAERTTLAEVIERYLNKIAPKKSFAHQKALGIQLKYFRKRIGSRTLEQITPAFVVQCRDALEATGRADSTINRYLASLSVVMTACVEVCCDLR